MIDAAASSLSEAVITPDSNNITNSSATKFPLKDRRLTKEEVNKIPTQVSISEYSNKIFISISQFGGNLGSFVEVLEDKPSFDNFDPNSNTYTIKCLFGKDNEEVHLAARIFREALPPFTDNRQVLFSIALKDFSKANLMGVKDLLKTVFTEN